MDDELFVGSITFSYSWSLRDRAKQSIVNCEKEKRDNKVMSFSATFFESGFKEQVLINQD